MLKASAAGQRGAARMTFLPLSCVRGVGWAKRSVPTTAPWARRVPRLCPPYGLSHAAPIRRRPIEMSAAGGDVKRIQPGSGEATFVRQVGRKFMALDDCALD